MIASLFYVGNMNVRLVNIKGLYTLQFQTLKNSGL